VLKWQRYSDETTSKHILAIDEIRDKHENKIKEMNKAEGRLKVKIEVYRSAHIFKRCIHHAILYFFIL